jgi:hypothetical protein
MGAITIDFSGSQPMSKEQWNQVFQDSGQGSMTYERYEMDFRKGAFNVEQTETELDVESARTRLWIKNGQCGTCYQVRSSNGKCGCDEW